jgi:succinate dehydrogenase / fumarate reductase membrane anchor subunit
VQARVSNIWWKTYNLLFLVLAIYHGLIGMWDVLKDYDFSPLVRLTLYGSVVTIGLLLLVVGLLIIVPMGL